MVTIIGLIIALIIAIVIHEDAKNRYPKGSSEPFLWALGVFLMLIIFLPIYLICRPKKLDSIEDWIKKCPQCAEAIKLEALKCRYCGYWFDEESVYKEIKRRKSLVPMKNENSISASGLWLLFFIAIFIIIIVTILLTTIENM